MKSLAIRGMVLLVVALAFAVPAFASTPNPVSATVVADLTEPEGNVTGTFEGTLEHIYTEGRADRAHFSGCVDGRWGELEMLLVLQRTLEPWAPGLEGKWVILDGSGDLEGLRGQGTFVVDLDFPILTMTLVGQYHFDPD
ncbi:MAG: hypothetical protein ACK2UA_18415 [Anaerolineae bacterium]|jgi:hypothetical protein